MNDKLVAKNVSSDIADQVRALVACVLSSSLLLQQQQLLLLLLLLLVAVLLLPLVVPLLLCCCSAAVLLLLFCCSAAGAAAALRGDICVSRLTPPQAHFEGDCGLSLGGGVTLVPLYHGLSFLLLQFLPSSLYSLVVFGFQVCQSVKAKLVGQKVGTFERTNTLVVDALSEVGVTILVLPSEYLRTCCCSPSRTASSVVVAAPCVAGHPCLVLPSLSRQDWFACHHHHLLA